MKMKWHELVKSRIKELNTSQEAVAEQIGVTPGGLGHWLNSRREPSFLQIVSLLKAININQVILNSDGTLEFIDYDFSVRPSISEPSHKVELESHSFPVISSVQAGDWSEAVETNCSKTTDLTMKTTERASKYSFWLKVNGDSMTSHSGISFPDGMYICVDPSVQANNKSFVVAKLEATNEATFKQLVIDINQKFLKPLNPNYHLIPIDQNCKIIGVVIDAKWKL